MNNMKGRSSILWPVEILWSNAEKKVHCYGTIGAEYVWTSVKFNGEGIKKGSVGWIMKDMPALRVLKNEIPGKQEGWVYKGVYYSEKVEIRKM